ncbi:MAG: DUF932 domain-containing protein [Deltaproteobacteria bacterium]|nr:DUF932 domain-containing protein [Deltaproteobacteria bacterium]
MRGKDTFGKAMEKVHEMSANNHDETIPVVDMAFDSLDAMKIAGEEVKALPSAQRLLANRLRVPYSYLSRCPAELQAENLNYWIGQEARKRDTLFCRFNGDGLRAVFTDRYKVIDHTEILSKMLEYGFKPETEVHYSLDSNLMVLKVPDYTRQFRLDREEIVPGISIANSEVGIVAFSIEAYFYRLVCSNGLVTRTEVTSRFKHISRKALDEFPEILRQVVYESEGSQRRFQGSLQSQVDDPLSSIGSFARQFNLTKKETEAVQSAWEIEQGFTLFHVINAFTRGAQDGSISAEESYRLERVAGMILAMVRG